jgi:serine phosphatase RsbU (regulator of sigma subunit)
MYHPKDIVSGDFYWLAEIDGELFVAVVDCTGHGVPGAFMSVMGNSLLNDAILQNKITETDEILNRLHHGIVTNLERSNKGDLLQDGMDMSLIKINRKTKRIQYSGANRPLIYMNGDDIVEYEPDKMSIGYSIIQNTPSTVKYFSKQEFTYQDGATIIQYSDGITDQFGGPNYRKFSNKSFIELLKCLRLEPAQEQCKSLTNVIRWWQGDHNQTDDMLVISIKLT